MIDIDPALLLIVPTNAELDVELDDRIVFWRWVVGWSPADHKRRTYLVRSDGVIDVSPRRLRPWWGRIELKQEVSAGGYRRVEIGGVKQLVHRVVLHAFRGPPPPGRPQARHLDGDPSNNDVGNLIWASASENRSDLNRHGTMPRGSNHGRARFSESDVEGIVARLRSGATCVDLGQAYGVDPSTIRAIAHGETWGWLTGIRDGDIKLRPGPRRTRR